MITKEKMKAVSIGHAVADALGVPVEFSSREELDENPLNDMRGFGTYNMPKGSWSDDTSMALASLDSLAAGALDFEDVMQKFGEWYYEDKYTPTGVMFDAGNTCTASIHRYVNYGISIDDCGMADEYSNGNGSLMRIYPFTLICLCNRRIMSKWEEIIEKASAITHAHPRSVLGCKIYTEILFSVINHPDKESIKLALGRAMKKYKSFNEFLCYERIFSPDFENTPREKINSSGYVVDTLEAAIWCLLTTNDYKSCVLKAANLGDDTDTVAAVAGSIAGALYGYEAIPERWRSALLRSDYIEELCERVYEEWSDGSFPTAVSQENNSQKRAVF